MRMLKGMIIGALALGGLLVAQAEASARTAAAPELIPMTASSGASAVASGPQCHYGHRGWRRGPGWRRGHVWHRRYGWRRHYGIYRPYGFYRPHYGYARPWGWRHRGWRHHGWHRGYRW